MAAWRMAFRDGTNGPDLWPMCQQAGVAAIEYDSIENTDLTGVAAVDLMSHWPLAPSQLASLRRFIHEMALGDTIFVKSGPKIVGRGVVVGPYHYDADGAVQSATAYWRRQRQVHWEDGFRPVEFQLGSQQIVTVKQLTNLDVAGIEAALTKVIFDPVPRTTPGGDETSA